MILSFCSFTAYQKSISLGFS